MTPLALVVGLLLAGAAVLAVVLPSRDARSWSLPSAVAGLAACAMGTALAAHLLWTNGSINLTGDWAAPGASLAIHVDALAALFLLPIFVLGGLGAVYGRGYWALPAVASRARRGPGTSSSSARWRSWSSARNAVLFLVAWEGMALSSFFLVTFDDERAEVRRAGWTYLVATHLGTAFLLALFVVLGARRRLARLCIVHGAADRARRRRCFVLALVGFGTKAGLHAVPRLAAGGAPAAPATSRPCSRGHDQDRNLRPVARAHRSRPVDPAVGRLLLSAVGLVSGLSGSSSRWRSAI